MSIIGPVRAQADLVPGLREGRRGGLLTRQNAILVGTVVIVALLALVPLLYLLWGAFVEDGDFSLDPIRRAYFSDQPGFGLTTLATNTLVYAVGSTLVSCGFGTVLAYLTERTDLPLRRVFFTMSLVPAVLPGVLYAIAWIFLASPRIGILTSWLEPVLGEEGIGIFGMPGMIFVQGVSQVPLVYLLMFAAFRSMDPALEESALMGGASFSTVIRRITVPTMLPAFLATLLLSIVRSLQSFEEPALLGMPAGVWVFTSRTWQVLQLIPPDFGQAASYSLVLLGLSTIGIYLYSRLSRRGRAFETVTGKGFRPRRLHLSRWKYPITLLVIGYFTFTVVLPVLVLLYISLQPYYSVPSIDTIRNSTLENYEYVLSASVVSRAVKNSLLLAVTSATCVVLLTAVAAWIVIRTRVRGRWILDNLTFLPLMIPGLVLGVGLIFVYLRIPLPIYGTIWILLIAYCTQYLPYGMRYASASMFQIGVELEESAQTSGASWTRTFRRIILPLLAPGLLAGWLFIVMLSVRELASSLLLFSPGNETIAVMIWSLYDSGRLGELAALGCMLITLLVALTIVVRKVASRYGVRAL